MCFDPLKSLWILVHFAEKIYPTLFSTVSDKLLLHAIVLFKSSVHLIRNIVLRSCHDVRDRSSVKAVNIVFFLELTSCRHKNSAYLHKTVSKEPELIMTFKNSHNKIALLNSVRQHHVSHLTALFRKILVSEDMLLTLLIDPLHSHLIRHILSQLIYNVI